MAKQTKPKRGRGQPKKEFEKQKEEILNRLSKGEPLLVILDDESMPSQTSFYSILLNDNEYLKKYREAKIVQAHSYADMSIITIRLTHQRVKRETAKKNEVQSAKNLADEYKWQAAKLIPKVYGTNVDEELNDLNRIKEIKIIRTKPVDLRKKPKAKEKKK